jgi:hypothetical protein
MRRCRSLVTKEASSFGADRFAIKAISFSSQQAQLELVRKTMDCYYWFDAKDKAAVLRKLGTSNLVLQATGCVALPRRTDEYAVGRAPCLWPIVLRLALSGG